MGRALGWDAQGVKDWLFLAGALGWGVGAGTPEGSSLSVLLCPEVLAEHKPSGEVGWEQGGDCLSLEVRSGAHRLPPSSHTHMCTYANTSVPSKGIEKAAPASAPAPSEPRLHVLHFRPCEVTQ